MVNKLSATVHQIPTSQIGPVKPPVNCHATRQSRSRPIWANSI
jgi:hypothetical protein